MRLSLLVAIIGLACAPAAFANPPQRQPGATRLVGHASVSDGTEVDWPDCDPDELPGIIVHRPPANSPVQVGDVEMTTSRGSWTFHLSQATDANGKPLNPDALKQLRLQADLYCKYTPMDNGG